MKTVTTLLMLALAGAFSMAQAQDVKGDVKAGEKKNVMCIGCHGIPGYQASFPQVHRVPMISGQNGKYIAAALDAYRKGDRKHPSMRGIGAGLSDQDIADLAAFYEQHGRVANAAKPPKAEIPVNLQAKLASCVACHGENFSDTIDPANPRLAGQHADYLYVALRSYKGGNHVTGRNNATMAGMVTPLSDKDMKQIANFLGSLPGELKTVPQARTR
jgi:cytochrome c553